MDSQISSQEESLSLFLWEERLLKRLRYLQRNGIRYVRLDLVDKVIVEKTDARMERLDNRPENL